MRGAAWAHALFWAFAIFFVAGVLLVVVTGWDPTPDRSQERVAECRDLGGVVLYDSDMRFEGCKVEP